MDASLTQPTRNSPAQLTGVGTRVGMLVLQATPATLQGYRLYLSPSTLLIARLLPSELKGSSPAAPPAVLQWGGWGDKAAESLHVAAEPFLGPFSSLPMPLSHYSGLYLF